MADIRDTLSAIDAATGCQQCGGPLGGSPSDLFCSERCQAAWTCGVKGPLAATTVEWRHPYRGRVVQPLCDAHCSQVLGALRTLAIGCSGSYTEGPAACSRCTNRGPARNWIDKYVTERIDSRGTR